MQSLPNPVLVGLESLAQRSDPFFDGHPELRERAWFYRDGVYRRYIPADPRGRSILDALNEASGYGMNAVSIVTEAPLVVAADLDLDQLRFMAARTRLVVVEIFDGESYAVWSPAAEQ
jgi:hypothetical protein